MSPLEMIGIIKKSVRMPNGLIVWLLLVMYQPSVALSQDVVCDTTLEPIAGELGYRLRAQGTQSERCEGLYEARYVGGLKVVSFLQGDLQFTWDTNTILSITTVVDENIYVQAMPKPQKVAYRMDSIVTLQDTLLWPIVIPFQVGLRANRLGVFGWLGSEAEKIFVPLQINERGEVRTVSDEGAVLELRAENTNFHKILWRLRRAEGGRCKVGKDENLTPFRIVTGSLTTDNLIVKNSLIRISMPDDLSGEVCLELETHPVNAIGAKKEELLVRLP